MPRPIELALVRARRGQGLFRDRVARIESRCRITGVENPTHLVASHCKPWRDATNEERLDGENGLLLTPTIDHLFDRGFIGFEDDGRLILSPVAHRPSLQRMGINVTAPTNVGSFTSRTEDVLRISSSVGAVAVDFALSGVAGVTIQLQTSGDMRSATRKAPPTVSGVRGIASEDQISIFSAISIASSTSMPR